MARLLDSFPPERIKKTILIRGGAFKKKHEFTNEGEKNRFFFILNKCPQEDDRLIIVTATTRIRKRKKHRPSEVLVEVTPKEYASLAERSIIDCESCVVWRRTKLEEEVDECRIEPLQQLPKSILERICNAISCSKTLPPVDKRLVLEEESI